MPEAQLEKGEAMLAEVALRYAAGHGLRPRIAWDVQACKVANIPLEFSRKISIWRAKDAFALCLDL